MSSDAARRAQQMSTQANNHHREVVRQSHLDRQRDGYLAHEEHLNRQRPGAHHPASHGRGDRAITVRRTGPGGTGFQVALTVMIILVFGGLMVAGLLFVLEEREKYRRHAPAEPTGSAAAPGVPVTAALIVTMG